MNNLWFLVGTCLEIQNKIIILCVVVNYCKHWPISSRTSGKVCSYEGNLQTWTRYFKTCCCNIYWRNQDHVSKTASIFSKLEKQDLWLEIPEKFWCNTDDCKKIVYPSKTNIFSVLIKMPEMYIFSYSLKCLKGWGRSGRGGVGCSWWRRWSKSWVSRKIFRDAK